MPGRSRAQQEMIEVIDSVDEHWPITLLYLTQNGANMKIQAGRSEHRHEEQLTLAAMYLLFLEENMQGDLYDVAESVAGVAEELRDDEGTGEIHMGGKLDDDS